MKSNTLSPNFTKQKSYRLLVVFTCLLVVLLGLLAFAAPPGIDPDPCYGFLVMHCMELGGHFNIGITPDPLNIAKDHAEFLAWWSPGQYLLPYFFKHLFSTNTGQAVALTTLVCELLGIIGYYKLFKKLGFTKWVAAISIAFIVSQLYFLALFTYYTGGEILIFGFMGWFLYGCFSVKKITWQVLLFVFAGGLVGFFCKSSVLWMYAASIACIWINVSMDETFKQPGTFNLFQILRDKKIFVGWLLNGILLAIPFVFALVCIYVFYLSKGANPTSDQGATLIKPETFLYPLGSPIVSGFSVDDLFDGLLYQPDGAKIAYHSVVIMLSVFAVCCLGFMLFIGKYADKKYARAMIIFYTLACLFFGYMYLKQANISYEGRHFRIIGVLFTPGLIYALFRTKLTQALFFMAWAIFVYWGYQTYHNNLAGLKHTPRGTSGLSQGIYDQATIDEVVKLDSEHLNDAVFVVTASDLAMEVTHNRVLVIDNDTPDSEIATMRNAGKGGTLFIITPNRYAQTGRRENINKTFVDYHHFEFKNLSKDYGLTVAKD